MFKAITVATVAAVALAAATLTPKPAQAENGQIAAGVVGGLAVGAIVGSQMNRHDGYRERVRYRECYVERRDFEGRYGRIHVRRVRVCD